MTFKNLVDLVSADLYRYGCASGIQGLIRKLLEEPGFRFTFLLRACRYFRYKKWSRWGVYHFFRFWHARLSRSLCVYIDFTTEIGPGLYLGHPCAIVVNHRCRVGANCNLGQNSTLGRKSREPREGCPVIGDRVYIGPGAVVIGSIEVGDGAAIGANSVVTKDIPPRGVVVGVPGRIISMRGSEGYVTNCLPGVSDASRLLPKQ